MNNRYVIRREMIPRYAVGGSQAARWCVCDTSDDGRAVGFGIRKYEAYGIANWLNNQNRISPLAKHTDTEPYWEWEQPGDNFLATKAQCMRAHHKSSLLGSYRYSSKKEMGRLAS